MKPVDRLSDLSFRSFEYGLAEGGRGCWVGGGLRDSVYIAPNTGSAVSQNNPLVVGSGNIWGHSSAIERATTQRLCLPVRIAIRAETNRGIRLHAGTQLSPTTTTTISVFPRTRTKYVNGTACYVTTAVSPLRRLQRVPFASSAVTSLWSVG